LSRFFSEGGVVDVLLGRFFPPQQMSTALRRTLCMPMDKYRCMTLQRELVDKIEQYIKDYPEKGYKSIADFVTDAARRRAGELRLFHVTPRFEHFNTDKDRMVILDRKLGPHANVVTLSVKPV